MNINAPIAKSADRVFPPANTAIAPIMSDSAAMAVATTAAVSVPGRRGGSLLAGGAGCCWAG